MSPIRVTFNRTVGHAQGLYTTALSVAGFLAVAAGVFVYGLQRAEGSATSLAAVWTAAAAPILPFLAALLAMGVWSDERQSGRMDMLLSVAVRERDYVLGKFFGVWTMLMGASVLSLLATIGALLHFAPSVVEKASVLSFVPPFLALAVQGALWSAASVALSAFFRHGAAAAASSIVLLVALPRALWAGLRLWTKGGATAFGEMPFDAHAVDWAQGTFSLGTVLSYLVVTCVCLLLATKGVAAARLVGRGARSLRASTSVVFALALVFAAQSVVFLERHLDVPVELPAIGLASELSPRTRGILSESSGEISVTCFLARSDKRFRPLGHLLRTFAKTSASLGGARFSVRFVDPRWDIGAAERLAARGISEDTLVLEKGRRHAELLLKDGVGERLVASTVRRLAQPPQRRNVCWLSGHGEASLDGYGIYGLSDVARELSREGYRNESISLAETNAVPADCALVVLAGPVKPLARAELDRLDAYLRGGGRLLALLRPTEGDGIASLLAAWGVKPAPAVLAGAKTLSGSDVIATDFSDHPIVAPLKGSRVVLERPAAFAESAVASSGADGIVFAPLVSLGGAALAAAVERGTDAGDDLAIRPTRIVVIGDATFALNGALSSRANANRDFLLNCVAYLSGTDATGASGEDVGVLVSGLDREARMRLASALVVGVPALVFLALAGAALKRRLRT
jgi:hypothetical protein